MGQNEPQQPTVVSVRIRKDDSAQSSSPTGQGSQTAGEHVHHQGQGAVAVPGWGQPCLITGFQSVISAGVLGYFFGVVPSMLRNRSLGLWRTWAADGWRSAGGLGVVSGAYTWVHCLCSRMRLVEDGWNRAVAGCATGLILGWKSGPAAAAQSALGLGLVSYFFDMGSAAEVPAAKAEALPGAPCCSACATGVHLQGQQCSMQHCSSSEGGSSSSQGGGACSGPCCSTRSSTGSSKAALAECQGSCHSKTRSCSSCLSSHPSGPVHNRLVSMLKPKPFSPQAVLATPPVVWLGQLMQQPVQ